MTACHASNVDRAPVLRLHPKDLDALADAVAERLVVLLSAPQSPGQMVDAATVADALGVARSYVYEHADELGAVRLGDGPKGRLRFDLSIATARYAGESSQAADPPVDADQTPTPAPVNRRRLPNRLPEPGSVLRSRPMGGDRAA